jgi:hypothetical protein
MQSLVKYRSQRVIAIVSLSVLTIEASVQRQKYSEISRSVRSSEEGVNGVPGMTQFALNNTWASSLRAVQSTHNLQSSALIFQIPSSALSSLKIVTGVLQTLYQKKSHVMMIT